MLASLLSCIIALLYNSLQHTNSHLHNGTTAATAAAAAATATRQLIFTHYYCCVNCTLLCARHTNRVGPARVGDSATAFRNLIDSWAVRFMEELDYLTEAANADRFRTEMAKSEALGEAIIVPRVHHALTDRYVLVTGTVQQRTTAVNIVITFVTATFVTVGYYGQYLGGLLVCHIEAFSRLAKCGHGAVKSTILHIEL
jgi:ABC1 atypical kinase-like domain